MNCPTCGAANEADAHFCAECGTPLENQDIEATIAGQVLVDPDNDMTIMSTPEQLAAEQAKTVTVDHSDVVEAVAATEVEENAPSGIETEPPPPPPPPASPPPPPPVDSSPPPASDGGSDVPPVATDIASDDEGGSNKTMMIVGIIVAVLLLCCCCCSLGAGASLGSDPELMEDIIRELSFVPGYLPFA